MFVINAFNYCLLNLKIPFETLADYIYAYICIYTYPLALNTILIWSFPGHFHITVKIEIINEIQNYYVRYSNLFLTATEDYFYFFNLFDHFC